MKTVTLPTLENKIKELASMKIENKIADLHSVVYGSERDDAFFQLLKGIKIRVLVNDEDLQKTIDLSVLFDDIFIRTIIKEARMAEYIEMEIEKILKKATE